MGSAMKKRLPSKKPQGLSQRGFAEDGRTYSVTPPLVQTIEIGAGGRVVIPAPMRNALGMKIGDRVTMRVDDNEVRIYTFREASRKASAILREFIPENISLVDELIEERRREAKRELEDD
jgi:AbrB family looped-hinge helix DNA binding protein